MCKSQAMASSRFRAWSFQVSSASSSDAIPLQPIRPRSFSSNGAKSFSTAMGRSVRPGMGRILAIMAIDIRKVATMLIFMDESGDTGFKLGQGSSAYFVIMLVLVKDPPLAKAIREDLETLRGDLRWHKEFHFSKTPDNVRESFLSITARHPLLFRAIVIPKGFIYTEFLKTDSEAFYN